VGGFLGGLKAPTEGEGFLPFGLSPKSKKYSFAFFAPLR
jgi:hypothetical protein